MKGGTILVFGQSGCYPGMGMRRGTIVFARKPAGINATFNSSGVLKRHEELSERRDIEEVNR